MAQQKVDAVIVGLGWAGGIAAKELADAGLSVVVLERGTKRTQAETFDTPRQYDELPYSIKNQLAMDLSRETITFRNNLNQTALPMRQFGSFNPSTGTGGSGITWSGHTIRALPTDFTIKSHITERYGADFIPDDMTIQDCGVTYEELEPHYDRFEKVAGTSGKAGNLKGKIQSGGNPFEGERSDEYPNPAFERTVAGSLFAEAAESMGYSPFPVPVSNSSQNYTNPYEVELGECRVCGHCPGFGCTYSSKGSAVTTVYPTLVDNPNVELRHNSYYKDAWGLPLLRMTFDFNENEHKMSDFLTDRATEIMQEMGAKQMLPIRLPGAYDITKYQTTHNVGGAIMGEDPKTSAVNRYLQS